jgi:hypothetical protein
MKGEFTTVIEKRDEWHIGYIEEIPGVNTQGKTLEEVQDSSGISQKPDKSGNYRDWYSISTVRSTLFSSIDTPCLLSFPVTPRLHFQR